MQGFVGNIEQSALENENFRAVLFTTQRTQLVVMSLKPGEEIGEEIHDVDQFLRVEKGTGQSVLNGETASLTDGFAIVVPAGVKHNIINTSEIESMKLYTVYAPPHHRDGVVHVTKEQAEADKEHFDGKTTLG